MRKRPGIKKGSLRFVDNASHTWLLLALSQSWLIKSLGKPWICEYFIPCLAHRSHVFEFSRGKMRLYLLQNIRSQKGIQNYIWSNWGFLISYIYYLSYIDTVYFVFFHMFYEMFLVMVLVDFISRLWCLIF